MLGPALGDGILTAEGVSWRWQRRAAAPLFRHQDLLRLVPEMAASAAGQIERWRANGTHFISHIERDMTDVTYDVITRTIFAGAGAAEGAHIKADSGAMLEVISWEIAAALIRTPLWLWHPGRARLRRNSARLRALVGASVARRRREGGDSGIIGRILAASDPETGAPMTDSQAVDNLLTFLLAGHESTAKALTWSLYLLARAPAWQERVRAEIRDVAGDAPITAELLDRLPVTTRVLKESLRLYPPAPMMTRMTGRAVELGGYAIGPGTLIILPVFAIHRHRKLWRDPDRYDPDRFLPENEAKYLRTQFMPFGFGPRTCIGMSFAMIEATVLLASFVRAARFGWDGRHKPEPVSRITLRPKGGMPLQIFIT